MVSLSNHHRHGELVEPHLHFEKLNVTDLPCHDELFEPLAKTNHFQ